MVESAWYTMFKGLGAISLMACGWLAAAQEQFSHKLNTEAIQSVVGYVQLALPFVALGVGIMTFLNITWDFSQKILNRKKKKP